jgi:hypothetical protein
MQGQTSYKNEAQIEEMKYLKSEIMFYNDLISKMEVAAILAISGIYVWLFSNPQNIPNITSALIIAALPVLLSWAVLIRYQSYQIRIVRCAAYIRCVEEELGVFGYERFVWLTRNSFNRSTEGQERKNSITLDFQMVEGQEGLNKREARYLLRAKDVRELPQKFSHFTKNTLYFWWVILSICVVASLMFVFTLADNVLQAG